MTRESFVPLATYPRALRATMSTTLRRSGRRLAAAATATATEEKERIVKEWREGRGVERRERSGEEKRERKEEVRDASDLAPIYVLLLPDFL